MAIEKKSPNIFLILIILIVVAGGVYYFLYGKDNRTTGDKVGDAVDSFSHTHSLSSAGDQLKDLSPADKVGDSVRDSAKQADK